MDEARRVAANIAKLSDLLKDRAALRRTLLTTPVLGLSDHLLRLLHECASGVIFNHLEGIRGLQSDDARVMYG
jgi:hypothetical protein